MNAFARKEIRLILPAWALAMVLAIFPVWFLWPSSAYVPVHGWSLQAPGVLVYGPFALGVLLLGLAPFGHELNYGTFSILLAQPVSRRRLWVTKTMTVGLALLIVFVALCVSDSIRVVTVVGHLKASDWQRALDQVGTRKLVLGIIQGIYDANLYGTLVYGGLSVIAAFSGGLWTNLLFRNTSAAFWLSLLVPTGLWMLAQGVFGPVGLVAQTALIATLVLYSAAGFFWAKKYFLHVQDVQWTGGIVSFPTWSRSRAASSEGAIARKHKPLRALLWKEIQFQQVNLLIASLLFVTHLIDLAVRKLGASYFLQHHQAAMIWESWPLLWLAMPFLIGAIAVAEERKFGTLETLLCLPTKRRREFSVKLGVAFVLGVLLGGIMPVLVEWIGSLIGVKSNAGMLMVNWTMISQAGALLIGSGALVMLAFYASTLTRNLLAALGLTVVWSIVAFFLTELVTAIGRMGYDRVALWGGKLPLLTIFPVTLAAVIWLSFVNFKRLQTSSRLWIRNVFVLVASLLGSAVVTTAIFNRVWEVWMPDEPVHSGILPIARTPSRFPNEFVIPKIETSLAGTAVILPDGRLWLRRCQVDRIEHKTADGRQYWEPREAGSWQSTFVAGTNWLDVAVTPYQCYAIQKDGSLWDLSALSPVDQNLGKPLRIGNDSNWKTITAGASRCSALKIDGTLWMWGKLYTISGTSFEIETVSQPRQIGSDHDWVAVSDCGTSAGGVVVKEDGSVWRYGHVTPTASSLSVSVQLPEKWLSGPSGVPRSVSFNGSVLFLISKDGSLWGGGYGLAPNLTTSDSQMFRLDTRSDWIDARFARWPYAIGIKRDHSLWMATIRWGQMGLNWETISRYNDWIAVSPEANNNPGSDAPPNDHFLALASDGDLCRWNGRILDPYQRRHYWGERRLLMPSRIKAKEIANLKP